jgi:hypothetical protein
MLEEDSLMQKEKEIREEIAALGEHQGNRDAIER